MSPVPKPFVLAATIIAVDTEKIEWGYCVHLVGTRNIAVNLHHVCFSCNHRTGSLQPITATCCCCTS